MPIIRVDSRFMQLPTKVIVLGQHHNWQDPLTSMISVDVTHRQTHLKAVFFFIEPLREKKNLLFLGTQPFIDKILLLDLIFRSEESIFKQR